VTPEKDKVRCFNCEWKGREHEILVAPSPFEKDTQWQVCPLCFMPEHIHPVCDEPGCWHDPSCGFPTPEGYRFTCHIHWPDRKPDMNGVRTMEARHDDGDP